MGRDQLTAFPSREETTPGNRPHPNPLPASGERDLDGVAYPFSPRAGRAYPFSQRAGRRSRQRDEGPNGFSPPRRIHKNRTSVLCPYRLID
ncbi:hypothetical protein SS05631_c41470 [Sinorhizobium sp. CCBAU 05631]|nr:hypothetical protein SS05631_c41470 [Sinorhizobium sp. CCBAU 05631]